MPAIIISKNTLAERTNSLLVKFTPFNARIIIITIDIAASDAKANAPVIKNVFKTLFSFDLYDKIIEKNKINS